MRSKTLCVGCKFSLISWICIRPHTIVILDPRICHDIDQGHISKVKVTIHVWVISFHWNLFLDTGIVVYDLKVCHDFHPAVRTIPGLLNCFSSCGTMGEE